MPGAEEVPRVSPHLEEILGSIEPGLRLQALTHVSWANEHGETAASNERLEYLGDAVLYLAAATMLYGKYPEASEGDLTRMRARLVSGSTLAHLADQVGLGKYVRLGRGEDAAGGRRRPRILAGALEAVIGAYYLSCGWDRARVLVEELLETVDLKEVPVDPKTAAQEMVQRIPGATIEYVVVRVDGPDHMPKYTVACVVNGRRVSFGTGPSKKEAEEEAARRFLELRKPLEDENHFA